MGKIITNRQLIATPRAGQLRYGVFRAATVLDMDTRMIGAGIQYLTDHCDMPFEYDQTCELSPEKDFTEGSELIESDPYWLVARKRCGTVGRSGEEMQAAVRQVLFTGAQQRVEAVMWDGGALTTATPTLTGAGATIVTPSAPGAGAAIAALEEAFYDVSGYVGTIHMNTRAYAAVAYAGLIEGAGGAGALRTPIGSVWSIGSGYGITGPADAAPAAGFVWAFMTAPVTVWRSGVLAQPDPRQTLDRELNQWDVVAEEVFAHAWDCPQVMAVQVPIAAPATTTAPAVP
jgi:hypothetical protein